MSTLATTACISQLPSEEHSGSYDHCRRRGKPPGRSTPPCLTKAKRPPAAACREALVVRWCGVGLDGRDDRGVRQVDAVDLEATGDLGLAEQVALSEVHVHERAFRARHGAERCAAGGGEAAGLAGQVEAGDLLAVAAVRTTDAMCCAIYPVSICADWPVKAFHLSRVARCPTKKSPISVSSRRFLSPDARRRSRRRRSAAFVAK